MFLKNRAATKRNIQASDHKVSETLKNLSGVNEAELLPNWTDW